MFDATQAAAHTSGHHEETVDSHVHRRVSAGERRGRGRRAGDDGVIQDAQPRQLDQAIFKYVGVAGIDQPRIVQVGVSAAELGSD